MTYLNALLVSMRVKAVIRPDKGKTVSSGEVEEKFTMGALMYVGT